MENNEVLNNRLAQLEQEMANRDAIARKQLLSEVRERGQVEGRLQEKEAQLQAAQEEVNALRASVSEKEERCNRTLAELGQARHKAMAPAHSDAKIQELTQEVNRLTKANEALSQLVSEAQTAHTEILTQAVEAEYVGDGTFQAGDEDCFKAGIKERMIYLVITK